MAAGGSHGNGAFVLSQETRVTHLRRHGARPRSGGPGLAKVVSHSSMSRSFVARRGSELFAMRARFQPAHRRASARARAGGSEPQCTLTSGTGTNVPGTKLLYLLRFYPTGLITSLSGEK